MPVAYSDQHKKSADQQSMNTKDTELTRSIREDVVALDKASTYAKNVKIISSDGKVTLKGPVRNQQEKNAIVRIARAKAGSNSVVDQITIEPETN